MTSSPDSTFVFVQLPDTGDVVVAGRYDLEHAAGRPVGVFVYARSYMDRPESFALDPENLPLVDRELRTVKNRGMFGVLRDAAPDFWGRLVVDRRGPGANNELEYLLTTTDVRVGALSFAPDSTPRAVSYAGVLTMGHLEAATGEAAALESEIDGEEAIAEQLQPLLYPSSPMGGARPKAVVIDDEGQLWVAKFPARSDRWNNAITESSFMALADLCGIRVPATRVLRVGDGDVLLVKRFDQEPSEAGIIRRPFISAYSLFDLDEDVIDRTEWSYLEFAQLVRKISSRPDEDARELFKRAVFNALVSNLDDHPRNHAMLMEDGGWRLSPAYDLTPAQTRSRDARDLAMSCGVTPGRERWANRLNLISGAGHFGVRDDEANEIITAMKGQVLASWQETFEIRGGTRQDQANIEHAIVSAYPGFEYPTTD